MILSIDFRTDIPAFYSEWLKFYDEFKKKELEENPDKEI